MPCECNLFNVEDTKTWHYECQWKVNEGHMTMFEYSRTCRMVPNDIFITESERKRLERNWRSRGESWEVSPTTGKVTFLDTRVSEGVPPQKT
jgi:hypothetical protein